MKAFSGATYFKSLSELPRTHTWLNPISGVKELRLGFYYNYDKERYEITVDVINDEKES